MPLLQQDKVNANAPDNANCSPDGSVIRPSRQLTAMATFGMWHEGKDLGTNPPSPAESETTGHIAKVANGVAVYGYIGGEALSSGRAEAAGTLVAIMAPSPQHLAIDKQSAVTMLHDIIQ